MSLDKSSSSLSSESTSESESSRWLRLTAWSHTSHDLQYEPSHTNVPCQVDMKSHWEPRWTWLVRLQLLGDKLIGGRGQLLAHHRAQILPVHAQALKHLYQAITDETMAAEKGDDVLQWRVDVVDVL